MSLSTHCTLTLWSSVTIPVALVTCNMEEASFHRAKLEAPFFTLVLSGGDDSVSISLEFLALSCSGALNSLPHSGESCPVENLAKPADCWLSELIDENRVNK